MTQHSPVFNRSLYTDFLVMIFSFHNMVTLSSTSALTVYHQQIFLCPSYLYQYCIGAYYLILLFLCIFPFHYVCLYCFYSQLIDYWWYSHTCRDNKTHAWLIQEIMESIEYQTGNRLSGVMSVSWHLHTTSGYCFVYIGNALSNNKCLVSMTMLSNLSASQCHTNSLRYNGWETGG